MAIRLNEALRASVGSTDAPNRVLDNSVSSDRRALHPVPWAAAQTTQCSR
jgi:hypothetical protein